MGHTWERDSIDTNDLALIIERAHQSLVAGRVGEARADLLRYLAARPDDGGVLATLDAVERALVELRSEPVTTRVDPERIVNCSELLASETGRGEVIELASAERSGRPLRIYRLSDVPFLGRYGVISSRDGAFVRESIACAPVAEAVAGIPGGGFTFDSLPVLEGEYISLCALWGDGFWHYMLEHLPRALMAELAGFRGRYLTWPGRSYIFDSLRMIGVSPDRIVIWDGVSRRIESLYVPEILQGHELDQSPALCRELRSRLMAGAAAEAPTARAVRRAYVARTDPKQGRRVINESALNELLTRYDFTKLEMERIPLAEQIASIANAEALVAPHGAGMLHSLFLREDALVVELFSPHYIHPCTSAIHRALGQRYYMCVADSPLTGLAERSDMNADLGFIESTLARELTPIRI